MVRAQNDLYMVVENDGADSNAMSDNTMAALAEGSLTVGELQRCAMNICRFIINAPVMSRPLKAYEPIKAFAPNRKLEPVGAKSISSELNLAANVNQKFVIEVPEDGIYQCYGFIKYDRDAQAQSTCSLSLNHIFSQTFSVHGTDGKVHKVDGLQVKLAKGLYELSLEFVKPGLVIEQLGFTKL